MVNASKHIIQKVHFKINADSLEYAHHLKENISDVLNSVFIPYLEKYFDEHYSQRSDRIIRIDELKVSLESKDLLNNFSDVTNSLKTELDTIINDLILTSEVNDHFTENDLKSERIIHPTQSKFDAFIYFLKTGCSVWWYNSKDLNVFLDEESLMIFLGENKSYAENLCSLLKEDSVVRKRISSQFSPSFIIGLLVFISKRGEIRLVKNKSFSSLFQLLNNNERSEFLVLLFKIIESTPNSNKEKGALNEKIDSFVRRIAQSKHYHVDLKSFILDINKVIKTITTIDSFVATVDSKLNNIRNVELEIIKHIEETSVEKEEDLELLEKGVFVENAGLIILSPFFSHFFETLGFLDEQKRIIQPDLAVQLLNYIATGEENNWEHNMQFEKFLCGVPLAETIDKSVVITKVMKLEVEELFSSLFEHWSILKNSTAELVRNEFLTRSGKLFQDSVSSRLIVERKTQDILIDKLPWNISIIKSPWSTNILYSTW